MRKAIVVILLCAYSLFLLSCKNDSEITEIVFFDRGSIRFDQFYFENDEQKEQYFLANLLVDDQQGLYWVKMIEKDGKTTYDLIKASVMVSTEPPILLEQVLIGYGHPMQYTYLAHQNNHEFLIDIYSIYHHPGYYIHEVTHSMFDNYLQVGERYLPADGFIIDDKIYLERDSKRMEVLDSYYDFNLGDIVINEGHLMIYHPHFDDKISTLIEENTDVTRAFTFPLEHAQYVISLLDDQHGFRLYNLQNKTFSSRFELGEPVIKQRPVIDDNTDDTYAFNKRLILETETRLLIYHVEEELWFQLDKSEHFMGYHTYIQDDQEYLMIYERGEHLLRQSYSITYHLWEDLS